MLDLFVFPHYLAYLLLHHLILLQQTHYSLREVS